MNFEYNIFSYSLLISGVFSLLLSILIFQSNSRAVKWFAGMMLASSIWAIAYSFELASTTLSQMLLWVNIEYVGITLVPATWILFTILFVGKNSWLTPTNIFLIFFFPALALISVWTNNFHHLHYISATVDDSGPFPLLNIKRGPIYYIYTVYFYFMLLWGFFLLITKYRRTNAVIKKQNRVLLIGAFVPWIVNVIYLLGVMPYGHIDLTPYAFVITSIVIGFGLMRLQLFELVPLVREKVIAQMRGGVLVLDANENVIDLNKAMERFLYPYSSHIIGKDIRDVFPDEVALRKLISSQNGGKIEIEVEYRRSERIFEIEVTPILEKRTRFVGTLLLFWDISDRKGVEERLVRQKEELTELNRLKDRLFSIIAHDLRGPLNSLVAMIRIMDDGSISDRDFKEIYLQRLGENINSTTSLLDNLLNWSRSQLSGAIINPGIFEAKTLTGQKLKIFEKRANDKKIIINDDLPEMGLLIHADKDMIDLVMRNLISNAIKFCRKNDVISITGEQSDGKIVLHVNDTGMGMGEFTQQHLFGLETKSLPGTENEKGTGIGLKLCKDFVEKNGGTIRMASKINEGSTFTIELPKA